MEVIISQAGIIDFIGTHPQIPTIFVANVGTAIPIANTIEILGSVVAAHSVPVQTVASGNTLTVDVQYASAAVSSVGTNAGLASFNSAQFTVDANGFVSVTGGSSAEFFQVDAFTAPGTNPVAPNGSGIITVTGGQVAAGTTNNVIRTDSFAANTYTIQIQRSQAVASSTIGDNGVSHFNSTYFTVDANGFVSINGTGVGETITGNTGGALSPTAGNWNILGTSTAPGAIPVQTAGAGSTLTIQVQKAQAIAATNATNVGLAAFNSTFFTVDANGFVSINGSGIGETITGNTGGALSPTAGNWNILGTSTAAGTTPVQTSGSVSTLTVQVQKTQAIASTDATKVGLAAFDSARFTVDANGFVTLGGTGVGETITGNTGGALSPTGGNWNILGTSTAAGTTPVQTAGSGSTLTVQVQKAQAIASTNATNVGLAAFNSSQFTVDANGFVSASGSSATTYTENSGTATPSANNLNILGTNSALTGYSPWTTGTGATVTVNMPGTVKWVVNATANLGTHTTIGAAITAASSGDDIFITPGSYTENLTLKVGVNLIAYTGDDNTPNVTIIGKATLTAAGSVTISNIRLQTNSDFLLAVTGSAASIVNLDSCYLNCTNNTGISFTSSSASSAINFYSCVTDLTTTGIALHTSTAAGNILLYDCNIMNSGVSTTASTNSTGGVSILFCTCLIVFSCSSTGAFIVAYSGFGSSNTTQFAITGTASSSVEYCYMNTGNAASITVGSGASVSVNYCRITTSAANAITGAGSLSQSGDIYSTTSTTSVTTNTYVPLGVSGTWTPNIQFNGSNTGITYTTQTGGYSVIGNVVFIWANIVLSSKGANTSPVTISNLPIATKGNGSQQSISIGNVQNIALSAGYTQSYLQLAANSAVGTISIAASGTSALASGGISNTQCANNSAWQFTGHYILD